MFCVALRKDGVTEAVTEDQFFHTAGIGLVSASVTLADGTSNLMLQGIASVRFTGFPQRTPFRIAKIEPLPAESRDASEAMAVAEKLREHCAAVRVNGEPLPDSLMEIITEVADLDLLASTVANSLLSDPMKRQRLLEKPDIGGRLRELVCILRHDFPV
jgi:ATP-dependent Lon protease